MNDMTVTQNGNMHRIEFDSRVIELVGTAHVSAESVAEAEQRIDEWRPDRVCIEIDEQRLASLKEKDRWRKMDIFTVLKQKKGFLLLVSLILSSFQRRIGGNVGVKPGEEMAAAIRKAEEYNIPVTLSDRAVDVTLRRAWRNCGLWSRAKLLSGLIASMFGSEEVSSEEIEQLKEKNMLQGMMEELAAYLPRIKKTLIDERDSYLAASIMGCREERVFAVVGAGHVPGIIENIRRYRKESERLIAEERERLNAVPPPSPVSRALPWIIPLSIVATIALGYIFGGRQIGTSMVAVWVIGNGAFALLGSIIALAHPVTMLVSFAAAPFTSLVPTIGAGIVAAFVETWLRKPRVGDAEALGDDILRFRSWYRNRITHVLLVLLFVSLGSAVATYGAWAVILRLGFGG